MAFGDVKYIVGRPFLSHLGNHLPGELAPKEASEWLHLHTFVASGLLYPYVAENGYANLPPHVYSAVVTLQEARGLIEKGDTPMPLDWTPAPELLEAQATIEAEQESRAKNEEGLHARAEKQLKDAVVSQVDPRPVVVVHKTPGVDAKAGEAAAAAADETEQTDYMALTKEQLVQEIEDRNKKYGDDSDRSMNISGTKAELVQRLRDDDLK